MDRTLLSTSYNPMCYPVNQQPVWHRKLRKANFLCSGFWVVVVEVGGAKGRYLLTVCALLHPSHVIKEATVFSKMILSVEGRLLSSRIELRRVLVAKIKT